MKLLACSSDLEDLACIVKRLVCANIPCAVCRDLVIGHLSVWVQRDRDFPLALRATVNRPERARLPHWARAFEVPHRLQPQAPHHPPVDEPLPRALPTPAVLPPAYLQTTAIA